MKSLLCLAAISVLLLSCLAFGDEKTPGEKYGWQRLFREQAADYRIDVGEAGEAELIPEAVLQWTHPSRGPHGLARRSWRVRQISRFLLLRHGRDAYIAQ